MGIREAEMEAPQIVVAATLSVQGDWRPIVSNQARLTKTCGAFRAVLSPPWRRRKALSIAGR